MAVSHPSQNSPLLERSEEHTSELQSPCNLVCRLLLEKKKKRPSYATCQCPELPPSSLRFGISSPTYLPTTTPLRHTLWAASYHSLTRPTTPTPPSRQ